MWSNTHVIKTHALIFYPKRPRFFFADLSRCWYFWWWRGQSRWGWPEQYPLWYFCALSTTTRHRCRAGKKQRGTFTVVNRKKKCRDSSFWLAYRGVCPPYLWILITFGKEMESDLRLSSVSALLIWGYIPENVLSLWCSVSTFFVQTVNHRSLLSL